MLKNYKLFSKEISNKLNESAPRIPNSEEYWLKKGKDGKKCIIYFHDDLDGIFSAIAMKNYLEGKDFEIVGYGVVNYTEGWSTTKLDPKYINIALDYAEDVDGLDLYMDHHGTFKEGDNKGEHSVKTPTSNAYEGIMDQLGLPIDSSILNVIDMVDSAKYDQYEVDIKNILEFDTKNFKNKLEFAAAFNQLLKRSDHKTFIEVVSNSKDMAPSIYNIFRLFRLLYPANNLNTNDIKKAAKNMGYIDDGGKPDIEAFLNFIKKENPKDMKGFEKDFLVDAHWRLGQVESRTRGRVVKGYIDSQKTFKEMFSTGKNGKIVMPGYQIIGNMCFVPTGTWANALRARAILEQDLLNDERIPIIEYHVSKESDLYDDLKMKQGQTLELVGDISGTPDNKNLKVKQDVTDINDVEGIKGVIDIKDDNIIFRAKQPIFWILLQYGNTMQIASLHKFENYVTEYLPKLKDGSTVENLGKYCDDLMINMATTFGYNVLAVENQTTKSGGHKGIGSVSNIFGKVKNNTSLTSVPNPENPTKQIELGPMAHKMMEKYEGVKFQDLIKNKMINDLSGVEFGDLRMSWGDIPEKGDPTLEETPTTKPKYEEKPVQYNKKTMMSGDIRNAQDVDKQNKKWKSEED